MVANTQRSNLPKMAFTTWSSPSWGQAYPLAASEGGVTSKQTKTISQCRYSLSDQKSYKLNHTAVWHMDNIVYK